MTGAAGTSADVMYAPRMRRLALFITLVTAQAAAADSPLSLKECQQLAQKNSPVIKAAYAGIDALEQQYQEAAWAWFPKISLRSLATVIPPQGKDDDGPDLTAVHLWSKTDISAVQPIYTFGKISALKAMAAAGVDVGHSALALARAELRYQVTRAWNGVALAWELQALLDDGEGKLRKARERLEELEADDDDRFDQADKFRLRIYEAQVATIVSGNRKLQNASRTGLRVAIARGDRPLNLPDKLTLTPDQATVKTLDWYVQAAIKSRPDLAVEQHKVAVAGANVDRHFAAFFPDLFLAGSFTVAASTVDQTDTVFSSTVFNAVGGGGALGLKWDLDIPSKVFRYRKAQSELSRARHEFTGRKSVLQVHLVQVYEDVVAAQELLVLRRRSMKAAKSLLTLKAQEYENGVADIPPFKDVLEASVTYLSQKSEWLQAIYTFNVGLARLSRVVGVDVTQSQPEEDNP